MEKCIDTLSVVTEEQEYYINCLYKYQQHLHKFFSYNNFYWWLEKEEKIDKAISSVRTGEYLDDKYMCNYINSCIICIKKIEKGK